MSASQPSSERAAILATDGELDGRSLGSIVNNDCNNILHALAGEASSTADYQSVVRALLSLKPGLLAQDVGLPDAVTYRSLVATTLDKYLLEVARLTWPESDQQDTARDCDLLRKMFREGTDILALTVEVCRQQGVPIVASYRMNSEDWYGNTWMLSDFGRAHPEYRIAGRGCLDPAVPEVYQYRSRIFAEVAELYDIDGIEFDFRRWYYMISDPLKNHRILTQLVRDTRAMLDETAHRKGRRKLLLGARVGPTLASDPTPFLLPGAAYCRKPEEASCRDLGLDVGTWIAEGLVDYICPSQFIGLLPGLPQTPEFAALARGSRTGVYPTLWPISSWMHHVLGVERQLSWEEKDREALALFKWDLCTAALKVYEDGADGISTFNWYPHLRAANVPNLWSDGFGGSPGEAADALLLYFGPLLKDREAIRRYRDQPWAVPVGAP